MSTMGHSYDPESEAMRLEKEALHIKNGWTPEKLKQLDAAIDRVRKEETAGELPKATAQNRTLEDVGLTTDEEGFLMDKPSTAWDKAADNAESTVCHVVSNDLATSKATVTEKGARIAELADIAGARLVPNRTRVREQSIVFTVPEWQEFVVRLIRDGQ